MENQAKIIMILVLVLIAGLAYAFYFSDNQKPTEKSFGLNPETISQEVAEGKAVLLDVRTSLELEQDGYVIGSTHFDIARIHNNEIPEIEKDTKVYIYCKSGGRAGRAKTTLEDNGFSNVENIGGLVDWVNAGGQITK